MNNYDTALAHAIDRDIRDQERLDHLASLVAGWLDAIAPEAHDMEHPDARWHPGDLVDSLKGELRSIRHEQARLATGPVVLDDAL